MRTQRKVVKSLALTVALGASATNLQVKADEVITPVAESTETVVTATPTTVSAEQVEQAKEVASADAQAVEAQTAVDTAATQTLATETQAVEKLTEAVAQASTAQEALPTAEDEVATQTEVVEHAHTAVDTAQEVVASVNDEVAKGESSALLAELVAKAEASQAEADRLATLFALQEEFNTVITEDEVTATPKDAPTAPALPAVDFNDLFTKPSEEPQTTDVVAPKDGNKGQDLNVIDNIDNEKTVVTPTVYKPQAGITVQQTATGEKVTYSRVERAHTLPNTGSEDNIVLMGIGFVLAGLGLAGARRRRHG